MFTFCRFVERKNSTENCDHGSCWTDCLLTSSPTLQGRCVWHGPGTGYFISFIWIRQL